MTSKPPGSIEWEREGVSQRRPCPHELQGFDLVTPSERRVKRLCTRLGLHLMTAQKPDRQVAAHGGYMLRNAETMTIVLGDQGYLFSSDLDEVERIWTR